MSGRRHLGNGQAISTAKRRSVVGYEFTGETIHVKEVDRAWRDWYRRRYGSQPPQVSKSNVGMFEIFPPSKMIR